VSSAEHDPARLSPDWQAPSTGNSRKGKEVRMSRIRILALGAALVLAAWAAVGVAGASPTRSASAKAISLTISANAVVGGKNDAEAEWITKYVIPNFEKQMNAAGDPVDVSFQGTGVADEAFKTQQALDLKTGGGADIINIDGIWVGEFADAGYIKPLDQIAGSAVDSWDGWKQISKAVQANMSYQGKRYGVPSGTDGRIIYYNKDLFQQAGLPAKWQPRTWTDILAAARKLKAKLPDVTPIQWNAGSAMGEATTAQGFLPLLAGTGKLIYDTAAKKWLGNTKNIRDVLTFYKQVYRSKPALGDKDLQLRADGRDRSFQEFSQEKIAMLAEGDYLWRSVINPKGGIDPMQNRDTAVGWALIPAERPHAGIKGPAFKQGQSFVSVSGGGGRILNPHTQHPKEAWELLAFMNSKDAVSNFINQWQGPRITQRADVNKATLFSDPLLGYIAYNVMPLTTYRPGFAIYPQVSVLLQLASQQVVSGTSVQKAAQDYQNALVKLVGANNVETS
jgi:multiple sugar transport system substrate-binding protein